MAAIRKPFQGIVNIIRFNWHFYLAALIILLIPVPFYTILPQPLLILILGVSFISVLSLLLSLVISLYIYDLSGLYQLKWIRLIDGQRILNVHAGFDEITPILRNSYPKCQIITCDFYDSEKHTEISIRRARKTYPPQPDLITVSTSELPFIDGEFNQIIVFMTAHEIRDQDECTQFFTELGRTMSEGGQIIVTEHLRDLNNFLAYTFGAFHFHTRKRWHSVFNRSGLHVTREIKSTPFITTFFLEKNDRSH